MSASAIVFKVVLSATSALFFLLPEHPVAITPDKIAIAMNDLICSFIDFFLFV
jgi:hypothetical protein